MTRLRPLPDDLAKTDASNTWTGTQDFSGATVLGIDAGTGGGTAVGATTTAPGVVQLAGDLAGTYTAPTVPALDGKADKAALAAVATSGLYGDLSGAPDLAAVATSGDYNDLVNRPAVPVTRYASLAANTNLPTTTDNAITIPNVTPGTYRVEADLASNTATGSYGLASTNAGDASGPVAVTGHGTSSNISGLAATSSLNAAPTAMSFNGAYRLFGTVTVTVTTAISVRGNAASGFLYAGSALTLTQVA